MPVPHPAGTTTCLRPIVKPIGHGPRSSRLQRLCKDLAVPNSLTSTLSLARQGLGSRSTAFVDGVSSHTLGSAPHLSMAGMMRAVKFRAMEGIFDCLRSTSAPDDDALKNLRPHLDLLQLGSLDYYRACAAAAQLAPAALSGAGASPNPPLPNASVVKQALMDVGAATILDAWGRTNISIIEQTIVSPACEHPGLNIGGGLVTRALAATTSNPFNTASLTDGTVDLDFFSCGATSSSNVIKMHLTFCRELKKEHKVRIQAVTERAITLAVTPKGPGIPKTFTLQLCLRAYSCLAEALNSFDRCGCMGAMTANGDVYLHPRLVDALTRVNGSARGCGRPVGVQIQDEGSVSNRTVKYSAMGFITLLPSGRVLPAYANSAVIEALRALEKANVGDEGPAVGLWDAGSTGGNCILITPRNDFDMTLTLRPVLEHLVRYWWSAPANDWRKGFVPPAVLADVVKSMPQGGHWLCRLMLAN